MTKYYIKEIVEINPDARYIRVLYTNGFDRWIKKYDVIDSCIPTVIDSNEDIDTSND